MLLLRNPRLFSRDVAQVSPSVVHLGVHLTDAHTCAPSLIPLPIYRAIHPLGKTLCAMSGVIGQILPLPGCIAWLVGEACNNAMW